MNFLWEVVLACKETGGNINNIHFTHAEQGSPYMELSLECLNQDDLSTIKEIEVFQSPAGLPDKKAEVGQGSGKKPNNGEVIKGLHPYTQTNKWLKMV